jgi:hypothetical protein
MLQYDRKTDGTFDVVGEVNSKHAKFYWLNEDVWEGGWVTEPTEDLIARMSQPGPYKYAQYRIVEANKPPLRIAACCDSCGLPSDVTKTITFEQAKHWTGQDNDWSESEDYTAFFEVESGKAVSCCDYRIDPTQKKNTDHVGHINAGFQLNEFGQIKHGGKAFCSVFCLAMGMFLYRNRRCANCAATLPKAGWTSHEDFKGENYPKYKFCSDECKHRAKRYLDSRQMMSTEHVMEALGMIKPASNTEVFSRKVKIDGKNVRLCASAQHCLKADVKGKKHLQISPAPAAPRSQYCSPNCRQSLPVRQKQALEVANSPKP